MEKENKTSILNRLEFGEIEIPSCVHSQTVRIYFISLGVFILGFGLAFMARDWIVAVITLIISLIIAVLGYRREYDISHNGCLVIEGVCDSIEYTTGSQVANSLTKGLSKEVPSRYIIRAPEGIFAILYFKHNAMLKEGDSVRIFLKNNVQFMEVRGANVPDSILGYELTY